MNENETETQQNWNRHYHNYKYEKPRFTIWQYLRLQIYAIPFLIAGLLLDIKIFLFLIAIYAVYCIPNIIIIPIALIRTLRMLEHIDIQRRAMPAEKKFDIYIAMGITITIILILLLFVKYSDFVNYLYNYRLYI